MIPALMDNTKTLKTLVTDQTCIARLIDCLSCEVNEKANGSYTAELKFPTAIKTELNTDDILKIKANPYDDPQLFRIQTITKDLDGITVEANHITYDLTKTSVSPCTGSTAIEAFNNVKKAMTGGDEFTLTSTLETTANFKNTIPQSARALMGGQDGSLLDVYGGYYYWDNLTVTLGNRGDDSGVTITYGKNLTSIEQETDNSSQYTHVVPYATKDDVTTIGDTIELVKNANPVKIRNLDLSEKFDEEEEITKNKVNSKAQSYVKANDQTDLKTSISLDYENLQKYGKEFKEEVKLCDKVHVYYPKLNVNGQARVIEYNYDTLKEEYTGMEIGSVRSSLSSTVSNKIASETTSLKDVANTIKAQQDLFSNIIANGLGLFETKETQPDGSVKIYLHNKKTIAESSVVYTMNADGFAISQDHGKTWKAGIDSDGNAVVNALSANIIRALQIYGSYIEGTKIKAGEIDGGTINGTTITGVSGDFTTLDGDTVKMNDSIEFFSDKSYKATLDKTSIIVGTDSGTETYSNAFTIDAPGGFTVENSDVIKLLTPTHGNSKIGGGGLWITKNGPWCSWSFLKNNAVSLLNSRPNVQCWTDGVHVLSLDVHTSDKVIAIYIDGVYTGYINYN